jgi:hypothetical protein
MSQFFSMAFSSLVLRCTTPYQFHKVRATPKSFLANHMDVPAPCDFFCVPMLTYNLLYVFVVLSHDRRRILHVNVTANPTAEWTGRQLLEAFPYDSKPKYLVRDSDKIYGEGFRVLGKDKSERLAPNTRSPMKALMVKQPWIDKILSGQKTWELRSSSTKARGQIALIESGSGTVVGTCEVVDVQGPLSLADLKRSTRKHAVPARQLGPLPPYKRTHAWVLKNARRLKQPINYKHPSGAVIWVTLSPHVTRRVKQDGA